MAAGLYGYASLNAWLLGRADTARDRVRCALAVAREQNAPFELAFAQFFAATLQLLLREPEMAEASAVRSVELSREHGFPYWAAMSQVALGRARSGRSDTDDGVAEARRGLVGLVGLETRINITLFLSWLAETQALEGDTSDALLTIEQALAANPEELAWRPDALRICGRLKLKSGDTERAEADFREAIVLAKQLGAKAWELRATMSLARLMRDTNRRDEARAMLAEVYNWFTEGLDTADLKDAKALLDNLIA